MRVAKIKPSELRAKLEEQQFRCVLTGDELTPENVSADHSVPVSRGGAHAIDNVSLVTAQVNAAKGTMTPEEFVALCRKVVAHADARSAGTETRCRG